MLIILLLIINSQLLIDCNGKEYSGAGWNSAMASSYGTYTFIAIGPSVVGILLKRMNIKRLLFDY